MSGLRHPVGGQDPRVYWVRRVGTVALLVVVVAAVVIVVRTLSGGPGGDAAAPPVTGSPSPSASPSPTAGGSASSPTIGSASSSGSSTPPPSGSSSATGGTPSAPATRATARTATTATTASSTPATRGQQQTVQQTVTPPTCTRDQLRVDLVPSTRRVSEGTSLTSQLEVRSATTGCLAKIDPWSLSITVMSGSDRVWTSAQCTGTVPRRTVWVSTTVGDHFPVVWNGRRSSPQCPSLPAVTARPGTYTISATLGASTSPHRVFTID